MNTKINFFYRPAFLCIAIVFIAAVKASIKTQSHSGSRQIEDALPASVLPVWRLERNQSVFIFSDASSEANLRTLVLDPFEHLAGRAHYYLRKKNGNTGQIFDILSDLSTGMAKHRQGKANLTGARNSIVRGKGRLHRELCEVVRASRGEAVKIDSSCSYTRLELKALIKKLEDFPFEEAKQKEINLAAKLIYVFGQLRAMKFERVVVSAS